MKGKICAWAHSFPPWFSLSYSFAYFASLVVPIMVYGYILHKFNQSRKQLDRLKKSSTGEDFFSSKISFHQKIGPMKKTGMIQIPGVLSPNIQILQMKTLEDGDLKNEMVPTRKRHPSTAKKIAALVSKMRKASYIMMVFISFLITWGIPLIFLIYESILQLTKVDPIFTKSNVDVDPSLVYGCLIAALQEQECILELDQEDNQRKQVIIAIRTIFHLEQTTVIEFIFILINLCFNGPIHLVLYAFWYPDFRAYVGNISSLFRKREQKTIMEVELDKNLIIKPNIKVFSQ